jgi:bacterioferritin-associated ferredoxin
MVVCLCEGVSEKKVRAAIESGARTRREVTQSCGAGGRCGGCHSTISAMLHQHPIGACASASIDDFPSGMEPQVAACG